MNRVEHLYFDMDNEQYVKLSGSAQNIWCIYENIISVAELGGIYQIC